MGRKRTVKQMADLAGVSARTLRYYEDIGLLRPARSDAGYRLYSETDAKKLARIIAMRSCGLSLETIRSICSGETSDILPTLKDHLAVLENQHESTMAAIDRTKAAIGALERIEPMNTEDGFEQMKREGLTRFEERYGQEARKLYGDDAIDETNERMMALTKDEWDAKELLEESIKVQLRIAMATHDPANEESRELVRMHRHWIAIHWGKEPSDESYMGLVQGYLADSRFVDYYDSAAGQGATEFLAQAAEAQQRKQKTPQTPL